MGISSWLVDIGISVEKSVTAVGTLTGAVPLQWPAGATGSFIYRLPRDPHLRASIFSSAQTIVVNEGEAAVVLEEGRSQGYLGPGRYVLQKRKVVGALDIVWFRTGPQSMKWGIGNVTSADNVQVSANGVLYARVSDPEAFNREIVQGSVLFSEIDLQKFLMPRVQGVLRTVLSQFAALSLQSQRDLFSNALREGASDAFAKLGVGVVDIEVVEIGLPAEFKAAIQEATLAQHTGRAALIQASTAAQVKQLEAQAAAQAQLLAGQAQIQLMTQMQSQGVDPLRFKALEALEIMAEHPAQGALGGDGARASLFGSVAWAALTNPPPVPYQTPGLPGSAVSTAHSSEPVATPAGRSEPSATNTLDAEGDVQRQLDGLVDRLSEGKISEETFKKLSERLEAKLAALKEQRAAPA